MRHYSYLLLIIIFMLPCTGASAKDDNKSEHILNHVDDLFRGNSSHGTFTMKVTTSHYTREMAMEAWTMGKDFSLIRIHEPQKEKGTATLKAQNNIWNYLPKVRRVIKIPSSMMGGSWMGSHFTNDDLIKENRMADDFTNSISFKGARDGTDIIELTLIPKPEAAVVWGKILVVVRAGDWIPLYMDYYDEDMSKTRTMTFSDIKMFDDRALPAALRIIPADKPGEYTEIIYKDIRFNIDLDEGFFTLRNLKR